LRDPRSPKNDATLAASWLHHAAVYCVAKSFSVFESIKVFSDAHAVA
jgi:hypothetical protein